MVRGKQLNNQQIAYIIKLDSEGSSYSEISRRFEAEFGRSLSSSTLSYHILKSRRPKFRIRRRRRRRHLSEDKRVEASSRLKRQCIKYCPNCGKDLNIFIK